MKKYLFGLGTMLVGAGLTFVLMHGEVSADSKKENEGYEKGVKIALKDIQCKSFVVPSFHSKKLFNFHENDPGFSNTYLEYCKVKDLTCVAKETSRKGIGFSCVKSNLF